MISTLRQGASLYILHKGEKPELKIGEVIQVGTPVPKYPTTYGQPGLMEMVANIKVRVEGEEQEYKGLPSNATIADFGNGIVISESADAMLSEVESLQRQSQGVIDSLQYHKNALLGYEEIRKALCPQYAKDQLQEERINKLESGLDEIKELLTKALKSNKN